MFIFIILAAAISDMPMPEICFLLGQFRRTILPKGHHGDSLSGRGLIERSTLRLRGGLAIAAPTKCSSPMPRCQALLWCAVGTLLWNQRYEKKD